jgi:DNA-binding response OmpR family regulator
MRRNSSAARVKRPLQATTLAGKLALYQDEMTAVVGRRPVYLTWTETEVLRELMSAPGVVRGRKDLLKAVWGKVPYETRAVDAVILRIRRKLGVGVIRAAYGAGYALAVPHPSR